MVDKITLKSNFNLKPTIVKILSFDSRTSFGSSLTTVHRRLGLFKMRAA